jgi:hypothetical protein
LALTGPLVWRLLNDDPDPRAPSEAEANAALPEFAAITGRVDMIALAAIAGEPLTAHGVLSAPLEDAPAEAKKEKEKGVQYKLSHALIKGQTAAVLAHIDTPQAKAEFLSGSEQGSAFLTANPMFHEQRIEDAFMVVAIKRRLGVAVCPHPLPPGCPLCKKTDVDITPLGSHVFSCTEAGPGGAKGMRGRRHKMVMDALARAMRRIAENADAFGLIRREPKLLGTHGWTPKAAQPANSADARGDLAVTFQGELPIIFDLVITHPIAGKIPAAATTTGAAAAAAAAGKLRKYSAAWNYPEGNFRPIAVETGGFIEPPSMSALRDFVRGALRIEGAPAEWTTEQKKAYARDVRSLIVSISAATTRATALALLHLADACRPLPGLQAPPPPPPPPAVQAAPVGAGAAAAAAEPPEPAVPPLAPAGAAAAVAAGVLAEAGDIADALGAGNPAPA